MFFGRTDVEAETPVLWPPDAKNWVTGKDPDAGKDWRQEEKGMTEDEMVGWHHRLDGHGFEQAPGVDAGQGSLECCSPWGCKELDMTEWLYWLQIIRRTWKLLTSGISLMITYLFLWIRFRYCSHFFFFSISTPFFLHVIHLLEEPGYWSYRMSTFGCLRLYVSFNLVYSYKVVFTSSSLTRFRFNILGMDAVYPVPLHQKAHIWLSNFCSTVICL